MTTIHSKMRRLRAARQIGLSLIELMIGLTIGMLLTLGLFTLIASQSMAFKVQDDFARIQENGALALHYLGKSVRMAGFYGYYVPGTAVQPLSVAGVSITAPDCGPTSNWAIDTSAPIRGFPNLTPSTVTANLPCIDSANFAPAPNPILITRSGGGVRVPDPNSDGNLTDGLAAQPNSATTIYLQADPTGGVLFYGANFAALKAANNGSTRTIGTTNVDVDIFEYHTNVYYIRPCSRPTGGGALCTGASDDGGNPIPTLVRQQLIGSAMTEAPLVEGVERMNVQYGIDDQPASNPMTGAPGDGVPDQFTTAPTAAQWPNVVSVRITVLVRSRSPAFQGGVNDSGKSYDLSGDGSSIFNCTAGTNCSYKRKVFSQTFQVRNLAQRRGA